MSIEGTYLNIIKAIYEKLTSPEIISYSSVKSWKIHLRSGTTQACPLLPLLFKKVLEVLARVIRQEKITRTHTGKEVKLTLFAENSMLYIENP